MATLYKYRHAIMRYKKRGASARRIQRAFRARRKKKSLQKQVSRLKRTVYDHMQNNWIDTTFVPTGISSAGTIYPNFTSMLDILKGDADNTRFGDKICLKKLQMKGQFACSPTDVFNEVRIIIFTVPDPNSQALQVSVTDVLENADVYSFYKKKSRINFNILLDKTFQLSNPRAQVGLPAVNLNGCPYKDFIHWETSINLKGLKVHYRPNATQGNNVLKNGLFMLLISDSALPSNPTFGYQARLSYAP